MTEEYRWQSGQRRDISSKEVLGNPVLCAQFIRDNVPIPCLKNVQPEDIEDVSERYRPYLGTEFESDTVKRIRIRREHGADPDLQLLSRISQGETFRKWIPDFTYEVVRLHDYSNEELIGRGNEMSLIMLFNKIQDAVDISKFLELPKEKLDEMVKDTPEAILDIIVSVMESLCMKIGATEAETRRCVNRVRERRMYLFENMEKMDIQAERRNTAEARADLARAQEEAKAELAGMQTRMQENLIRSVIHVCCRMNTPQEHAVREIMRECAIDEETARQKAELYWETNLQGGTE